MKTLIQDLSALLGNAFEAEGIDRALGATRPADRPDLADYQCNGALAAAKAAKRNPRDIAAAISARLADVPAFASVEVAGPGFINLTLSHDFLSERLAATERAPGFGGWRAPGAEKIVIDYGGPNIAKPLHVGHLRSAIIGEALKRLLRNVGHDVAGDIHLGDWGLPMGQLITELELEAPELPYFDAKVEGPYPSEPPITIQDLERLYPKASAACKSDPARAAEAKRATGDLQEGRAGYRALWRHFIDLSRRAIERDYADLGVSFDLWKGESDADPLIPEMAAAMRAQGLTEIDDGAEIIRVARDDDKKEIPPLILFKSDGSVLYGTTDLATIVDRARELDPARMLYVVDQRQGLHFEQVFRAAGRAGLFPVDRLEHVGFGTMNGKDGKPFKTREGGVLKLRDLIDMVDARARERLEEGGFAEDLSDSARADVARKVGIAALKFADLVNPRTSDYVFDLDRFLSFEGKTGPYLLYAVVRIDSVLSKAGLEGGLGVAPNLEELEEKVEWSRALADRPARELALALGAYGDAEKSSVEKRMPHFLAEHAYRVAQAFSKFYAACRIGDEPDAALRAARLRLAAAAGRQLIRVLETLGLETAERM
ncbi:MAG: arginine--tRNA ligase [Pseudomonadota bacterium]